jgi:DNA-directed RNA polymerase specialized sigma subunit
MAKRTKRTVEIDDTEHFHHFAKTVEKTIESYGGLNIAKILEKQKIQVDQLAALEVVFMQKLKESSIGEKAYMAFIDYIMKERRNVLSAMPFFRERFGKNSPERNAQVPIMIRNGDWKGLQDFHVNFLFVALILNKLTWTTPEELEIKKIIDEIVGIRKDLVVLNLPLVISRAKIFWGRTQKSNLSYMDIIQVGVLGLIKGIDKYCGAYSKVWRTCAMGMMHGGFIANYSKTLLRFSPKERKILYRARKFLARHPDGDFNEADLIDAIEMDTEENREKGINLVVSNDEVADLIAASSTVSCDTRPPAVSDDDITTTSSPYEAPNEERPDVMVEEADAMRKMLRAANSLSIFDKKLLRLKGIQVAI